jgi:hypothetical protein
MYQELGKWLQDRGIGSYLQGDDQLILSAQNPAVPSSNCLWVQKKGDEWYIGTWLPAAYRIPKSQDVGYVCETVFRSSAQAIYTIDKAIADGLKLRRLSDEEMEDLGFA